MHSINHDEFLIHACEQVLRFSKVKKWGDLSEERKVQFVFNVGVVALGLSLSKKDGFSKLINVTSGISSMEELNKHLKKVISENSIPVHKENISKPF